MKKKDCHYQSRTPGPLGSLSWTSCQGPARAGERRLVGHEESKVAGSSSRGLGAQGADWETQRLRKKE